MVPLFSRLLPGEVVAHVRSFQIYIACAGGYAVQYRVGHQLALYPKVPLVRLELRGRGPGGRLGNLLELFWLRLERLEDVGKQLEETGLSDFVTFRNRSLLESFRRVSQLETK